MKQKDRITWSDINLGQFEEISSIMSKPYSDEEKTNKIVKVIYDCDANNLSIRDYIKITKSLTFLTEKIVPSMVHKKYIINNKTYTFDVGFNSFSIAQFIDYSNIKKNNGKTNELLACFLIPEGKNYGEYDREEVTKDILLMGVEDAIGVCNFFTKGLIVLLKIFQYSSILKILKIRKMSWKKKLATIKMIRKATKVVETTMG